ncbi:relaxase/mobilization nuclease domain-containing protein [Chitinophaga filiformis]|uniref:Relaxase/mobilization nuclease domain-containing protein n=1 Tax=Chitinophaga filiformis TaxID=104663 RepID=A0ABY4HX82_CHIFI|nr:relaxase/mobilization nuclease domain-containing protein [Chitinophaga filiformis]UPK68038.1 relaxase/mobilization nuclease domain-containing protein [Chitinophaga filiformis]
MVAKVICGKHMRRLLSYNELKVEKGVAQLLAAEGFGLGPERLNFYQKLHRFSSLAARNEVAETNVIHISLNFPPEEQLDCDVLQQIAADYMTRIGFGDQPYLVYQHFDAGHPHLHIVTTCIQANGDRIPTHNIGKEKSAPARLAIEAAYGLIPAKGRRASDTGELPAAWLRKVRYGQKPTKATIAEIVGGVLRNYHFGSLQEYNAVLRHFGVMADSGAPGSRLAAHQGLVYRLLDEQGQPQGVPIKASSLYKAPTIKNLHLQFLKHSQHKKKYAGRLTRTIDQLLQQPLSLSALSAALEKEEISLVVRSNSQGIIYGFTYIDHLSCCVFNGSQLGKKYSAPALLRKMLTEPVGAAASNQQFVDTLMELTPFAQGTAAVMQYWQEAGLQLITQPQHPEPPLFWMGRQGSDTASFVLASKAVQAYLLAAASTSTSATAAGSSQAYLTAQPNSQESPFIAALAMLTQAYSALFIEWIEPVYTDNWIPAALLREAKKKKKRKRLS